MVRQWWSRVRSEASVPNGAKVLGRIDGALVVEAPDSYSRMMRGLGFRPGSPPDPEVDDGEDADTDEVSAGTAPADPDHPTPDEVALYGLSRREQHELAKALGVEGSWTMTEDERVAAIIAARG